jgi:hypothetical protein
MPKPTFRDAALAAKAYESSKHKKQRLEITKA